MVGLKSNNRSDGLIQSWVRTKSKGLETTQSDEIPRQIHLTAHFADNKGNIVLIYDFHQSEIKSGWSK
jgi:hypothetical protein